MVGEGRSSNLPISYPESAVSSFNGWSSPGGTLGNGIFHPRNLGFWSLPLPFLLYEQTIKKRLLWTLGTRLPTFENKPSPRFFSRCVTRSREISWWWSDKFCVTIFGVVAPFCDWTIRIGNSSRTPRMSELVECIHSTKLTPLAANSQTAKVVLL